MRTILSLSLCMNHYLNPIYPISLISAVRTRTNTNSQFAENTLRKQRMSRHCYMLYNDDTIAILCSQLLDFSASQTQNPAPPNTNTTGTFTTTIMVWTMAYLHFAQFRLRMQIHGRRSIVRENMRMFMASYGRWNTVEYNIEHYVFPMCYFYDQTQTTVPKPNMVYAQTDCFWIVNTRVRFFLRYTLIQFSSILLAMVERRGFHGENKFRAKCANSLNS